MYVTADNGAFIGGAPAQSRDTPNACVVYRLKLLSLEIVDTNEAFVVAARQEFTRGGEFDASDGTYRDLNRNSVVHMH